MDVSSSSISWRTGVRLRDEPRSVKPLLKTISASATSARSKPVLPVNPLPLPAIGGAGGGGGGAGGVDVAGSGVVVDEGGGVEVTTVVGWVGVAVGGRGVAGGVGVTTR